MIDYETSKDVANLFYALVETVMHRQCVAMVVVLAHQAAMDGLTTIRQAIGTPSERQTVLGTMAWETRCSA